MKICCFIRYDEYVGTDEEIELLHSIKKETSLGQQGKEITGMAILLRKLFIVREKISTLEVYDCNNFIAAPEILTVQELEAAVDICCCKRNNYLYIMDSKKGTTNEVLKISTIGELLISWSTKYNARGNLSATTEGNVIITVQEKHMLLEYAADGKLMRKIRLPECANPWHAVKLEDGRYVVSHGILTDEFIRVCLVDEEGKVAEALGPKSESAENQLNMPMHLAVGSNGCVIVAEFFRNRVLLLDFDLKYRTNIVPKYKQGFRNPKRVCLDEKLLAVVIAAGKPRKTINDDEVGHKIEAEAGETSTEKNALLRQAEEGTIEAFDSSQKIEKNCRLLVFNMEPLLTKYGV